MDEESADGGLGDAVAVEGTPLALGDEAAIVKVIDIVALRAGGVAQGVYGEAGGGTVAGRAGEVVGVYAAVAEVGLAKDEAAKTEDERTGFNLREGDFGGRVQRGVEDGAGGAAGLATNGDELSHAVHGVVGDVGDVAGEGDLVLCAELLVVAFAAREEEEKKCIEKGYATMVLFHIIYIRVRCRRQR